MLFSFPPSFLAWVFVRADGCSSFIFFLSLKKINVLLVCWLTKTMTKKWRATAQSSPPLGLLAVPLRGLYFIGRLTILSHWLIIQTDDVLPINLLNCRFLVRHTFRCCQYIYALPCIALVVYCTVLTNLKLHWLVCVEHFL
jgi:hypothetical protein